jgi:hypothetical protein
MVVSSTCMIVADIATSVIISRLGSPLDAPIVVAAFIGGASDILPDRPRSYRLPFRFLADFQG